jgi:uncharacterized protein
MTTPEPRVGNWMQTYSGRAFWPLDPRAEEIDPLDIAHALGMLCRYGGHVRRFYSVAEHCVLMSEWAEKVAGPKVALWALLHDATEAYVGDMVRPLKQMMPDYAAVEDRLMRVICLRFHIPFVAPPEVHEADNRILLTERTALMVMPPPLHWGPLEELEPLPVQVQYWTPVQAEIAYTNRLDTLIRQQS